MAEGRESGDLAAVVAQVDAATDVDSATIAPEVRANVAAGARGAAAIAGAEPFIKQQVAQPGDKSKVALGVEQRAALFGAARPGALYPELAGKQPPIGDAQPGSQPAPAAVDFDAGPVEPVAVSGGNVPSNTTTK